MIMETKVCSKCGRNETDIKVKEILKLTTAKPIFGHISGKRANTHWICFMKEG